MRILYQIRLVFKTDVQPDGLVRLIDDYLVFACSHSVLPYGKQYTIPAVFLLVFSYANYRTADANGDRLTRLIPPTAGSRALCVDLPLICHSLFLRLYTKNSTIKNNLACS